MSDNTKTIRLFNTITGKWYVIGQGFVAASKVKATVCDSTESLVVRYTYANAETDTTPLRRDWYSTESSM